MESLAEQLLRHEGLRLKPYYDVVGRLTIGVGRNLDDVGITYDEAMAMLQHDIARCVNDCTHAFPWFMELTETRQQVVLNMCFNLGLPRLLRFTKMRAALEVGQFETAANEMLDSVWSKQVGHRAIELANLMRGSEEV